MPSAPLSPKQAKKAKLKKSQLQEGGGDVMVLTTLIVSVITVEPVISHVLLI